MAKRFTGKKFVDDPTALWGARPHYTQEYLRWADEFDGGLDVLPEGAGTRNKTDTGTWHRGVLYLDDGTRGYGQGYLDKNIPRGTLPGTGQTGTGQTGTGQTGTGQTDLAALFASLIAAFRPQQQQPATPQVVKLGPSKDELKAQRRDAALKAEGQRRTRLLNALASRGSRSTIRTASFGLGG